MDLELLMQDVEVKDVNGLVAQEVIGIAYHTRDVRPGFAFVAIPGARVDGQTFVPAAIAAGATTIVTAQPVSVPAHVTNVVVAEPRAALARMAAQWYGEPSKAMRCVGVTGTNGKTTTSYLLESVWRAAKRRPGVIGTVNVRYAGREETAPTTTPESLDLQRLLRTMQQAGVHDVVMEVSSHALTQSRVAACHFDGAIFTNLTQDHLDYHGDMASYAAAKRRLFTEVVPASVKAQPWVVINADDPASEEMVRGCKAWIIWYSVNNVAGRRSPVAGKTDVTGDWLPATGDRVYAEDCTCTTHGIQMQVVTPLGRYVIASPLMGRFNASNILGVAAAAFAMGLPTVAVQQGIRACGIVPGRLEAVPNTRGFTVLVDYAHTPDALRNVCATLRELCRGRLITVFGCGGDRDPGKRPLMGVEAGRGSDVAIVTSDNPRTEDPNAIIAQIVQGLKSCGKAYRVIPDRRAAIHAALEMATTSDVVLIAGKGHEDYQIIGTTKQHFDDREIVKEFFYADSGC